MAVLEVRNLSKSYGGVRALSDVSFSVAAGEMVAMIGPNGAGKTTCFNVLNGQLSPDSGEVLLGGVHTLTGPVWGAAGFTWLQDAMARSIDYWRAAIGGVILFLVLARWRLSR